MSNSRKSVLEEEEQVSLQAKEVHNFTQVDICPEFVFAGNRPPKSAHFRCSDESRQASVLNLDQVLEYLEEHNLWQQ